MLYETLSQPIIILCFTISGFVAGSLFDIKSVFTRLFKKNKVFEHIFAFFATFFAFFCYFFTNLICNYGTIRFFTVLVFLLSFGIERSIMANFLAKPMIKWYNNTKEKRNGKKKT